MAEQLCVDALIRYAQIAVVDLAPRHRGRPDAVDGSAAGRCRPTSWLYDPPLDGIDDGTADAITDLRDEFRATAWTTRGMFAVFSEHNDGETGAYPLATLRMARQGGEAR